MNLLRTFVFLIGITAVGVFLVEMGRTQYPVVGLDKVQNGSDARLLVTGSSHANAVNTERFHSSGLNIAYEGADGFETAYLTHFGLSHLPRLELVLLVVSPFTFVHDWATFDLVEGDGLSQRRIEIYGQYPQRRIMPNDHSNYMAGFVYPLVTSDHWGRMIHGHEPYRLPPALDDKEKLDESAEKRAKSVNGRYETFMKIYEGSIEDDVVRELSICIERLRERSVSVVLLTPPYWRKYVSELSPKIVSNNFRAAERLSLEMGVPYLNYMEDARFIDDPKIFWDADHLASDADAFYKVLADDIQSILIEQR